MKGTILLFATGFSLGFLSAVGAMYEEKAFTVQAQETAFELEIARGCQIVYKTTKAAAKCESDVRELRYWGMEHQLALDIERGLYNDD